MRKNGELYLEFLTVSAVRDTRGEYLVFDGRVVPAYYSSCCGGAPASATDAIREGSWMDIAPLNVVSAQNARTKDCCEKAPTARWKVTLPIADFTRRLNNEAQFGFLFLRADRIALLDAGEAALGADGEAIKIDEGGGVGDPALQNLLVLQRARFGRDKAQNHRLAPRHKS